MDINDIDTPSVLIDLDKVDANLRAAQDYGDAHGLTLRPHVKTHKLPRFARLQQELGAVGITAQKLGEAEAMADGGIEDIFLPYNILGHAKLERLYALHKRTALSVTADNAPTIAGYAARFTDPSRPLSVLVECDTGAGRCGVQTASEAVELAKSIDAAPGLTFAGLMSYPPQGKTQHVQKWLVEAMTALTAADLRPERISIGGTPDLMRAAEIPAANEYRPGTYIYGDRMQVAWGHGALDRCALTVLATVVSRPTPDRAILDSGSKALAADLCGAAGHGHIVAYPEAVVTALSEEHAIVDLSACPERPEIGERLQIIPNHCCVVTNLFDHVYLMRKSEVEEKARITSRGDIR
ncbi:MAG: D-TA family PLP-dependent enzyme [Sedimentitalea sp.]|uniref:D-TA family PLP-dependent enzyme n=1 Tax=Sedimentitalea sp. TaxID=2048915 RepID=UPI0032643D70